MCVGLMLFLIFIGHKMFITDLRNLIDSYLFELGFSNNWSANLAQIIVVCTLLIAMCIIASLCKRFLIPLILKIVEKTETKWDDYLINPPVLKATFQLLPSIAVYTLLPFCYDSDHATTYVVLSRLFQAYISLCVTFLVTAFLKNLSTAMVEQMEEHHLMGILQFLRLLTFFLGGIVVVSLLLGYNPTHVITGLGAAATVLMLIFKDSIMGLVAGIQLSLNKMLKVGDWITIKKLDINGLVEEISLTTVKVRNFDNTISTIPPYTLVSDAFQNWDAMAQKGARRVKRALLIDVQSIRFVTQQEVEELREKHYLTENVETKNTTNLTLFRNFLTEAFKRDKDIVQDQWILVRQLDPTPNGIPLEIWFYTQSTEFVKFEDVASSKIELIIAMLPSFHLRLFQSPTGHDIRSFSASK